MGIFNNLFGKKEEKTIEAVADNAVLAVCDGEFIPAEKIADPVFAENMMGQTVAIEPTNSTITSPVNGTLEVVFPTGHAFAVRANDGTGYLVHIGIDTVSMNGEGFKALKKQGDTVKAGETVVEVDFNKVEAANHPKTTMIIITEPVEDKTYSYIDFGTVKANQIISK
ncbi:MAG: PTS glucose transporter subunit IIA [Erysipelotrichaceae bacterium]|nr:PTS glucose transporter subunit IIA [Erysipelotrichaceae bacterium]